MYQDKNNIFFTAFILLTSSNWHAYKMKVESYGFFEFTTFLGCCGSRMIWTWQCERCWKVRQLNPLFPVYPLLLLLYTIFCSPKSMYIEWYPLLNALRFQNLYFQNLHICLRCHIYSRWWIYSYLNFLVETHR